MRDLAKLAAISDVALAKSFRAADVPLPPVGYWNKLRAGHQPKRIVLSLPDLITPTKVQISGELDGVRHLVAGEPGESGPEESLDVLEHRFRARLGTVQVDGHVIHPSIKRVMASDERARQQMNAVFRMAPSQDIAALSQKRRFAVINALLLTAEKQRGMGYVRRTGSSLEVCIFRTPIEVFFDDPEQRLLAIRRANDPRQKAKWRDDDSGPIEQKLTEIAVWLARGWAENARKWEGERRARLRMEAAQADALRLAEIKAQEEAEERRRAEEAAARIQALVQASENLRTAETIRTLADEVRRSYDDHPGSSSWVTWALSQADRLDPKQNGVLVEMLNQSLCGTLGGEAESIDGYQP